MKRLAETLAILAGVGFLSLADDTSWLVQAAWLAATIALGALAVMVVNHD